MKRFLLSLLVVVLFGSVANAQFYACMSDADSTMPTIYAGIDTAKVVAVGGFAGSNPFTVGETSTSKIFVAGETFVARKVAIHKMVGDTQGPEKALLWVSTDPAKDPGRGRFKMVVIPADGTEAFSYRDEFGQWVSVPANAGYWYSDILGQGVKTCLTVVLIPEDTPTVTLLCLECGEIYTEVPIIDANGNLMNSICPVCGGVAVTSDTLTPEVVN